VAAFVAGLAGALSFIDTFKLSQVPYLSDALGRVWGVVSWAVPGSIVVAGVRMLRKSTARLRWLVVMVLVLGVVAGAVIGIAFHAAANPSPGPIPSGSSGPPDETTPPTTGVPTTSPSPSASGTTPAPSGSTTAIPNPPPSTTTSQTTTSCPTEVKKVEVERVEDQSAEVPSVYLRVNVVVNTSFGYIDPADTGSVWFFAQSPRNMWFVAGGPAAKTPKEADNQDTYYYGGLKLGKADDSTHIGRWNIVALHLDAPGSVVLQQQVAGGDWDDGQSTLPAHDLQLKSPTPVDRIC